MPMSLSLGSRAPGWWSLMSTSSRARRPSSGGHDLDRDPVDDRVARDRVDEPAGREMVVVDARVLGRDRLARTGPVVAPAVGQAHDTEHHLVAHLDGDLDAAGLGRDTREGAVDEPQARSVVRVDEERAAVLALHEHADVVEPRVLGADLPTTHEHETVTRPFETRAQPGGVVGDVARRDLDPPRRCAQL